MPLKIISINQHFFIEHILLLLEKLDIEKGCIQRLQEKLENVALPLMSFSGKYIF